MSDVKSPFTKEQITNLQMARGVYQGRLRDFINRRAGELMKFGRMQSSKIITPNQQELAAQVQKLQAHDFEIKRLGDCIFACTTMISFDMIPDLLDNLKNIRDVLPMAYETLIDVNAKLEETSLENVTAVSCVRDFAQFAGSLYPETNVFEQASFLRHQQGQEQLDMPPQYLVDGKPVTKEEYERVQAEQQSRQSAESAGIILS